MAKDAAVPNVSGDEELVFGYPVHEFIRKRRSPRAFSTKSVEAETLGSLLEAARWAPSSFNEQPWNFIVATQQNRPDFERLLACLTQFNIEWARHAPVLMLSIARLISESSGKPNRHAFHDVGQSIAGLTFQATAFGLVVHQMAGFDVQKARHEFSIPDDHEPVAVAAIGYPGDPATLSDKLRARELAPRKRKLLREFVFTGTWGQPAPWTHRQT
jgi:nitroreductase